jgi:hypothetical protein
MGLSEWISLYYFAIPLSRQIAIIGITVAALSDFSHAQQDEE